MTRRRFKRLLMSCGVSPRIAAAYVGIIRRTGLPYGIVLQELVHNSLADRWLLHVVLDCNGIVEADEQGGYYAWTWRRGAFHQFTVMAPEIRAALPKDWLKSRMVSISHGRGMPAKVRVIKTQMVKEDIEQ